MPKEIEKLITGYKYFHEHYFQEERALFDSLAEKGQKPKVLVIACSDSRVDPSILLHCQPGDLFVIRNVANLVPPCEVDSSYHGTSAALDFGVRILGIRHIIVFGHTDCGGIHSFFSSEHAALLSNGFIASWMRPTLQAYDITNKRHPNFSIDEKERCCSQYSVLNSLRNVATFPWIKERLDDHSLFLHGWFFDMTTGVIQMFDTSRNTFVALEVPVHPVSIQELDCYWKSL